MKCLPILFFALSNVAFSADQNVGRGTTTMKGTIVDTPCAISPGDYYQAIELDTIPISQIVKDGKGPAKNFQIQLINCSLSPYDDRKPDWTKFSVTFDGNRTGEYLFDVTGSATGVALQIEDLSGNIATPGAAMAMGDLVAGGMTLNYAVRLSQTGEVLMSGNYSSYIRFKMDYY